MCFDFHADCDSVDKVSLSNVLGFGLKYLTRGSVSVTDDPYLFREDEVGIVSRLHPNGDTLSFDPQMNFLLPLSFSDRPLDLRFLKKSCPRQ